MYLGNELTKFILDIKLIVRQIRKKIIKKNIPDLKKESSFLILKKDNTAMLE